MNIHPLSMKYAILDASDELSTLEDVTGQNEWTKLNEPNGCFKAVIVMFSLFHAASVTVSILFQ